MTPAHTHLGLSLQLRYQTVMSSLFLISIQKTVSKGKGTGREEFAGGWVCAVAENESQRSVLTGAEGKPGLPLLGFACKSQGSI